MARRRIGQEVFGFAATRAKRNAGLNEVSRVIDWAPLELLLNDVYAAEKGEAAWPPLARFRALLRAVWYDLSDARLAEALEDRASFRRFRGFSMTEAPERTAFVRFRRELVARKLDAKRFKAGVGQIEGKGLVVRTGTLVDATLIGAASKGDGEATWSAYAGRAPVKGYKAHIAADEDGGIVRNVAVTPPTCWTRAALPPVLPRDPGAVYADKAYDSSAVDRRIREARGTPRVARRINKRSRPRINAARTAMNAEIAKVRCRIEKIFGTVKRGYGMRRARWIGLARTAPHVRLTLIGFNLRRATAPLRPRSA